MGSETVTVSNANVFHTYTIAQVNSAANQTLVSFGGTVTAVASNYYTVSDGSNTVKVIPATYNQATNAGLLNKAVTVKGCMWTFTSLGKVVNFADVQYPIQVWYKFDETSGTTAADSGGLGYNATVTSPTWTAGKVNNCLQFNGTATYASVPALKTMSAFSMGGWLYVSGMSPDYSSMIFGSTNWGGSAVHFQIRSSDGDIQFSVGGAGDVFSNFKFAGGNLNQWVHVFATYDSATRSGRSTSMEFRTTRLLSARRSWPIWRLLNA